ncbi:RdgB/HAM1 family non-canonical purine NTP pyrophosphatase [bacterium]|nr:RdgB/HAM1 family non-canonical purine NTP pyrophosphatase [bacterium]
MIEEKILVATTNSGKFKEIKSFLSDLPVSMYSLKQAQIDKSFPEQGHTFLENARGKSLFYSEEWDGLTLGEDSGLEIDYLHGAPGVLSARFSGPQATDEKNIQKVLKLLQDVPYENRKARFVASMVLSQKGKIIKEIQEFAPGTITFEKKGHSGFGYDPIFYYPPLQKTFAQLSSEEKNAVSHRGRALRKLKEFLHQY